MRYTLSWWDGCAFAVVLVVSVGIGVWHGVFGRTKTNQDLLLGSKNMPMLPSVLSMIGSFVSGQSSQDQSSTTDYYCRNLALDLSR